VGLIICGDQDPYCPTEAIKSIAAKLACRLDIRSFNDLKAAMKEKRCGW
jgi:hypothetical protein